MPMNLPNLDDRRYEDLLAEALARIPLQAPEWTNHNASDPGITLVELFAFFTEMLIYRLNRVTDANVCKFLKLIDGVERTPSPGQKGMITKGGLDLPLNDEVRDVVMSLRRQDRAVTTEDFERLALDADPQVRRAYCVPQRDLTQKTPAGRRTKADGHVSVVVAASSWSLLNSGSEKQTREANEITTSVIDRVRQYLDERRLLTTRLHVVKPRPLNVAVHVTLYLKPDAIQKEVAARVEEALQKFFDPLRGGPEQRGWPFGRAVYVSEIYALLDRIPGVDYVTRAIDPETKEPLKDNNNQPYSELTVTPADAGRVIMSREVLEGIKLEQDELVAFVAGESHLQMIDPKIEISQPLVSTLRA